MLSLLTQNHSRGNSGKVCEVGVRERKDKATHGGDRAVQEAHLACDTRWA